MKGVTFIISRVCVTFIFQSTPPVRGVTAKALEDVMDDTFQSTPPVRGVTFDAPKLPEIEFISIHTPCEGGDLSCINFVQHHCNFNPHPL